MVEKSIHGGKRSSHSDPLSNLPKEAPFTCLHQVHRYFQLAEYHCLNKVLPKKLLLLPVATEVHCYSKYSVCYENVDLTSPLKIFTERLHTCTTTDVLPIQQRYLLFPSHTVMFHKGNNPKQPMRNLPANKPHPIPKLCLPNVVVGVHHSQSISNSPHQALQGEGSPADGNYPFLFPERNMSIRLV